MYFVEALLVVCAAVCDSDSDLAGSTKENIRRLNKMSSDTIFANSILIVPQCEGAAQPAE